LSVSDRIGSHAVASPHPAAGPPTDRIMSTRGMSSRKYAATQRPSRTMASERGSLWIEIGVNSSIPVATRLGGLISLKGPTSKRWHCGS
jgi:hypothetical protein